MHALHPLLRPGHDINGLNHPNPFTRYENRLNLHERKEVQVVGIDTNLSYTLWETCKVYPKKFFLFFWRYSKDLTVSGRPDTPTL